MAIDAPVLKEILKGLGLALNDAQPGATLTGDWSLEQKAFWEECGSRGTCWKHGVDASKAVWDSMVNEAARLDTSLYNPIECYSSETTIYFGTAKGKLNGTPIELRAHVAHTAPTYNNEMIICMVWVKAGDEVRTAKWAAGFSGCYKPGEFHTLGMELAERQLPPPREIRFA